MINIINIIKEFLQYLLVTKFYQKIELTESDKNMLEAFDKDIIRKIVDDTLFNLHKEVINNNISREYMLGYKQSLGHILSYFKKYNK